MYVCTYITPYIHHTYGEEHGEHGLQERAFLYMYMYMYMYMYYVYVYVYVYVLEILLYFVNL